MHVISSVVLVLRSVMLRLLSWYTSFDWSCIDLSGAGLWRNLKDVFLDCQGAEKSNGRVTNALSSDCLYYNNLFYNVKEKFAKKQTEQNTDNPVAKNKCSVDKVERFNYD